VIVPGVIETNQSQIYKDRKGLAGSSGDIVILTFYNAQRRRLFNALSELAVELNLPPDSITRCVHTVDSYQGREAKYVILDTTVCTYQGAKSLEHGNYHDTRLILKCTDFSKKLATNAKHAWRPREHKT
jgi:hypothetical protein